jgi:GTPase involved in cell partitioning and DNA repair
MKSAGAFKGLPRELRHVRFELSHAAYVGYVGFPYLSVRQ